MNRIPLAWRRRLPLALTALAFAAGNLVFFLSYRASTHERRVALESRRDDLKRAVEGRETEAARLTAQRDRLSGVSEAMDQFYGRRIGTQKETLDDVVDDLHADLKDAGVDVKQISYATGRVEKLPLTQLHIGFSAQCDYARFKKLLRILEAGKRWFSVQNVSIRREGDHPGAVSVQLELVTYFVDRAEPGAGSSASDPQTPQAPPATRGRATGAPAALPARSVS